MVKDGDCGSKIEKKDTERTGAEWGLASEMALSSKLLKLVFTHCRQADSTQLQASQLATAVPL